MTEPLTREQFAHLVSTYISEETWLERGKQIIAHDAAIRAERDALKEQLGEMNAANYAWMSEHKELSARYDALDDAHQDLTKERDALQVELAKAERIGGNAVFQVSFMIDEIKKAFEQTGEWIPADVVDTCRSVASMLKERVNHKADSAAWEEQVDELMIERDALKGCVGDLMAQREALKEQVADVVPRSRYDACNRDWLEAKAKLKQVRGAAFTEIADLTRKLAERTVNAENILLHVLARPDLGEAYPTFCKLWRAECEQQVRGIES